MRGRSLTLVVLAMLSPALAQDRAPAGRGAPGKTTLTRSASRYQALENRLVQALRDRSDSQIDQILASDFEVWSTERSGSTSRQDWQKAAFAAPVQPSHIRDLTVREFGEVAIVSFVLQGEPAVNGAPPTVFVVDVWTQGTSTLRVRYQSTPGKPIPDERRRE